MNRSGISRGGRFSIILQAHAQRHKPVSNHPKGRAASSFFDIVELPTEKVFFN
jgi:hypothetical protein